MTSKTYDNEYITRLLLFLADKISGNLSSIGFVLSEERIVFLDNSRVDVLTKIVDIFSKIRFLEDDIVVISGMPVLEAKRHLNSIAAFQSGRFGVVGPLSFILGESDIYLTYSKKEAKLVMINKGAVKLDELRNLFETVYPKNKETVKEKVVSKVGKKLVEVSACRNPELIYQEV